MAFAPILALFVLLSPGSAEDGLRLHQESEGWQDRQQEALTFRDNVQRRLEELEDERSGDVSGRVMAAWSLTESVLQDGRTWFVRRLGALEASRDYAAYVTGRAKADALFKLRMAYVYGTIFPRAVDEIVRAAFASEKDGARIAHGLLGDYDVRMSEAEFKKAEAGLLAPGQLPLLGGKPLSGW